MSGDTSRDGALGRVASRLRRELARDRAQVEDLVGVAERRGELDRLDEDLDRQVHRLEAAAVITLVGATGAGKSTLLNALVGADVASEGVNRPTTTAPVVYAPVDADLGALLADLPGEAPQVVRYDAGAGGPWTEQVLVDAPDVNSVAAAHRDVVHALASRSDVLLVVVHRQSLVEEASVSFVDEFAGRRALLFALNRADELTDDARAELEERLARLARERWDAADAPVVALSARAARARPDEAGFAALCGALRELVLAGRLGAVRRHNALGTAAAVGGVFAEAREAALPELESLAGRAGEGARRFAETVGDEVRARLALREPEVAEALYTERSRRWDGPVGWVLRARGASGLGLAAGAALARRNPLLAAWAAAGGMAADAGRESLRERRLRRADPLLPEDTALAGWYGEALGEARLAAARLAGDPGALGVPSEARARERAAVAVEEAWSRLFARELPAAAEVAVRPWLRVALDLPVYALVVWVVALAAKGFFSGSYLGTDFLVNAGLLAAAYLFVARFAVRRGLGLVAGRLVRGASEGAEAALLAWADEVAPAVEDEVGARRDALGRLAELEARWREALGVA